MSVPGPHTIDQARELDRQDPLGSFRQEFVQAEPDTVYLNGNSLGRLPKESADHLEMAVAEQWGRKLIRSWNDHWYDLPERLGNKVARIIGACPDEVILSDSTSVNLFKLASGALRALK